jgi:PAS domain S-box-containing protein
MELGEDPPMIRRSLLSASGEYRTHELHRRMLRDSSGNPVGICCATFDVSEIESAHRDARQAKQWLESVIEAIPQAVIVTDALGFVRFSNPAAEALTGWPAQEQLGKQIEKVIPILRYNSTNQGTPSFRMALREPWNGDVELLNRERQTVSTWLSASPIVDRESGYTNGIVIVLRSRPVRVAS